ISKLTKEQAMYHFLSGYTSKLAGTERGITKPEATFSACFGAPLLSLPSSEYAEMLGEKIDQFNSTVFLVNTGWTEGSYGKGELNTIETIMDDVFGLNIPTHVAGVPDEVLIPRQTWSDKEAYDQAARKLAKEFRENFEKFSYVSDEIKQAGPLV